MDKKKSFKNVIFARRNAKTDEEMTLIDFFKKDRFAMNAGVELLETREGYARARMLITPEHLNGGGVCQGGALFTLADLAFAAAVNSHLTLTFSTSSNITFIRSAASGYVYAEAVEVVNHPRMPYGEVRVTDEQGELLAIFTSSGYRKKNVTISLDEEAK